MGTPCIVDFDRIDDMIQGLADAIDPDEEAMYLKTLLRIFAFNAEQTEKRVTALAAAIAKRHPNVPIG